MPVIPEEEEEPESTTVTAAAAAATAATTTAAAVTTTAAATTATTTTTNTMDEFVNWDNADPAVGAGAGFDLDLDLVAPQAPLAGESEAFMFENVDGDDFSFWALEHYAQTSMADAAASAAATSAAAADAATAFSTAGAPDFWETPGEPCAHCKQGGYQCKTIQEGRYKGYCTSCVALRCQCSFGLASATTDPFDQSTTFPPNPWPTLGDHPNLIPHEDEHAAVADMLLPHSSSAPGLSGLAALAGPRTDGNNNNDNNDNNDNNNNNSTKTAPKIGARFSRESVKTLKNWLSMHNRHPYPTEEEKEALQKLTGLNKTQITNWLANARRRGKVQAPRSTSPHVRSWSSSGAIDIPQRRGTPSPLEGGAQRGVPFESMNPLQRWANSPPENEPALVSDIARAINTSTSSSAVSSGLDSPYSFNYTDDGSGRSLFNGSSASSVGTSHSSGGSFASAYSHASRGSFGSFGSHVRGRRRRRRRTAAATTGKPGEEGISGPTPLTAPLKTFQCTFCTETFRTKHDWQRHEKSLHLSLERWICAPKGPTAVHPETKQACCVFCGAANPDEAHVEAHNYSACQERAPGDRTFYRKDHLRQHLKLVHDVKFVSWAMEPWKVATPEIRSRCGFCGIVMDTWTFRVDHLAEHFKTGNTMADWKGDWGFDAPVLEMVENSIPPYLIHDERNSPLPYIATAPAHDTPRSAYELLKLELAYWLQNQRDAGRTPTDDETQVEACRIVFGAEVLSQGSGSPASASTASWLRDLLMTPDRLRVQAQLSPIRGQADSRLAALRINGKDNPFADCQLELQLREFVAARSLLGLTAMDAELQREACNAVGRMEESSSDPSDEVANFLLRLINGSTAWLAPFRQRAHLPRSEEMADEAQRSKDPRTIDSTIHNYSRLESELADFVRAQRAAGVEPDDASLQRQARIIIYEFDDGWNQTAADNAHWLAAFKSRHLYATSPGSHSSASPGRQQQQAASSHHSPLTLEHVQQQFSAATSAPLAMAMPTTTAAAATSEMSAAGLMAFSNVDNNGNSGNNLGLGFIAPPILSPREMGGAGYVKRSPHFLNDANCYRRLAQELKRFVMSTTSPNNPSRHVPTDQELQHQARWILYDDDDPWNQTAADNAEWLQRFKRSVGILPADGGPGLPTEGVSWHVAQGGSGFAPPYCRPKARVEPFAGARATLPAGTRSARVFETGAAAANKFLQSFTTRYPAPAEVFCSRELESGLIAYVQEELTRQAATTNATGTRDVRMMLPSDAALKARAREIMGTGEATAADDDVLLAKFKDMVVQRLALAGGGSQQGEQQMGLQAQAIPELPAELDIDMDADLNIAMNMDLDLDLTQAGQAELDDLFKGLSGAGGGGGGEVGGQGMSGGI